MGTIEHLRCQRGALIFLTPLVISAIVLLMVLALDGARLFMLKSELQSQANAAAGAASSESKTCGGDNVSPERMLDRALAGARVQGFESEAGSLTIEPGKLELKNDGTLIFRPTGIDRSDSALAVIRRSEPISRILPDLFGSIDLEVNAAMRKQVVGTLSAAGSTATIDDGLLGYLIGALLGENNYTLDVGDLDSLENSLLTVGELLRAADVDSLEDLLPLNGDHLALAVRDVAGHSSPVGELANDLLSAAGVETVVIGDLIHTSGNVSVPENTSIRAYDLLVGLAISAARDQQTLSGEPISVNAPFEDLGLPFIDEIDEREVELSIVINQPPTIAIGRARQDGNGVWETRFHAADIGLEMKALYQQTGGKEEGVLLPGIRYTFLETPLSLAIALGGGSGELVAAKCARGVGNSVTLVADIRRAPAVLGTGILDGAGEFQLERQIKSLTLTTSILGLEQPLADVDIEYTVLGSITVPGERRVFDDYKLNCSGDSCRVSDFSNAEDAEEAVDARLEPVVHDINITLIDDEAVDEPDETVLEDALRTLVEEGLSPTVEAVGYNMLNVLVKPTAESLGISFGGVQVSVDAARQSGTQLVENVEIINQ